MKLPESLKYWGATEVAECLDLQNEELYVKLWSFFADCLNPTPQGGDGSNGTVEEPAGRLDLDNDDKAGHWWGKLAEEEQRIIVEAAEKELV